MELGVDRIRRYAGRAIAVSIAAGCLSVGVLATGARASTGSAAAKPKPKPTIVLVHGAWANTASWDGETRRLQAQGYTVFAPPNPLQGVRIDAPTIRDFLKTIKGPIVLVGHSYGGEVITNAARGLGNVKALVYVDAFLTARGETTAGLTAKYPGSLLVSTPPRTLFRMVPQPGVAKSDPLLYVNEPLFLKAFANDMPRGEGRVLAASQAPQSAAASSEPSGSPAWASIPSWDVVGTIDRVIPPRTQLFMAHRAHAHITEVHGGHLSLVSHPGVIASVIARAARTVGG